jgi:hypothetical protein
VISDPPAPRSLTDLLNILDPDHPAKSPDAPSVDGQNGLTFQEMLDRIGPRSFGAVLLIPALILVSPLSAIPLMPTLGGLVVVTIAVQAFFGRRHLWLPRVLANRKLSRSQLTRAVRFLRRPAAWLDKHSRRRMHLLTGAPLDRIAILSVILVAATWPFLELVPMFTSVSATGVALVAFALMVRDGIILISGYAILGGTFAFVLALISGLV